MQSNLIPMTLASTLALVLSAGAQAETAPAPAEAPAAPPAVAAPATPAVPPEIAAAREQAEQAHAKAREEHDAWRAARYQELRERAKEVGMDLPETPPWESRKAGAGPLVSPEERRAHREAMRDMTPEQREAFRLQRYQELRERAKEQGVDLPETPPWKARQEAMAKHMEVFQAMSDEQKEACRSMGRGGRGMMGPGPGAAPGNRPWGPPPWMDDAAEQGGGYGYPPAGYGYGPYGY